MSQGSSQSGVYDFEVDAGIPYVLEFTWKTRPVLIGELEPVSLVGYSAVMRVLHPTTRAVLFTLTSEAGDIEMTEDEGKFVVTIPANKIALLAKPVSAYQLDVTNTLTTRRLLRGTIKAVV